LIEVYQHEFDGLSRSSELRFHFISDIHAGSRHILENKLDSTIKQIQEDEFAYWFGLGDLGDWICFSDRRFENYEMASWMDISDPWASTIDWLEEKLKPIAGKCLGIVPGNHEYQAKLVSHFPVHKHLAARLGVLDLGEACFFRLLFNRGNGGRLPWDIFMTHGWGGGRTGGARVNKLEQLMRDNDAMIYAIGHVHGQLPILKSVVRRVSKNKVRYDYRYGLVSGTYLLDSEYERRSGYPASVIGSPCVTIVPYHDHMEVKI